jgi:AcrR family transcriptional regulator
MQTTQLGAPPPQRKIKVNNETHEHLFQRRKEARPVELMDAALDIFVKKGFAATRLDDVAAKAGVSKGTIYLYFKNKEALFKAVVESGLKPAEEVLDELAEAAANRRRPAIELLHCYLHACRRILLETRAGSLLRLLVAESGNFPEVLHWFQDAIVRRSRNVVTSIVETGIARGEFRPVVPGTVSDLFFSPLCLCAFGHVWGNFPPTERFLEEAFDVLIRGLLNVPTN